MLSPLTELRGRVLLQKQRQKKDRLGRRNAIPTMFESQDRVSLMLRLHRWRDARKPAILQQKYDQNVRLLVNILNQKSHYGSKAKGKSVHLLPPLTQRCFTQEKEELGAESRSAGKRQARLYTLS